MQRGEEGVEGGETGFEGEDVARVGREKPGLQGRQ